MAGIRFIKAFVGVSGGLVLGLLAGVVAGVLAGMCLAWMFGVI
jgi:hypothetical protein